METYVALRERLQGKWQSEFQESLPLICGSFALICMVDQSWRSYLMLLPMLVYGLASIGVHQYWVRQAWQRDLMLCPRCTGLKEGGVELSERDWHGVMVYECSSCGLSFSRAGLQSDWHKGIRGLFRTRRCGQYIEPVGLSICAEHLILSTGTMWSVLADADRGTPIELEYFGHVASDWPPPGWTKEVAEKQLAAIGNEPLNLKWRPWYVWLRGEKKLLVGVVWFSGPADEDGRIELRCSIVESHQRRGFGNEIVNAALFWPCKQGWASSYYAYVGAEEVAWRKVLERSGFEARDEVMVAGRGRVVRWVKESEGVINV